MGFSRQHLNWNHLSVRRVLDARTGRYYFTVYAQCVTRDGRRVWFYELRRCIRRLNALNCAFRWL